MKVSPPPWLVVAALWVLSCLSCVVAAGVGTTNDSSGAVDGLRPLETAYPLEPVLVVSPFIAGHLVPLIRLARELANAGHAVTVVTHDAATAMVASMAPNVQVCSRVGAAPRGGSACVC